MEKSGKISQYRKRLDRTLASSELKNLDALETLVRNQLQHSSADEAERCSDKVIAKRTSEVSNFLDMLRSASETDHELSKAGDTSHGDWKLKDDNEEYRVMYRPGPMGTPFHSLLVEGYIDGPVDVCLCISWEASLYRKWWPQFTFPPFKITKCQCLQKVQLGEQICLVRVKVPWPMSAREAVMHYFLFKYLQHDLLVVLFNTISDLEGIDKGTHGFTKDGIPEANEVVRIDVVGGFALQKVTAERSYFRTIANMDMKLDFVPPSLINFISRQLIGSGFRLYQKTIASLSNYDEDYSKALEDPMYTCIHEALYSVHEPNGQTRVKEHHDVTSTSQKEKEQGEHQDDSCLVEAQHSTSVVQKSSGDVGHMIDRNVDTGKPSLNNIQDEEKKAFGEIEEEVSRANEQVNSEISLNSSYPISKISQNNGMETNRDTYGEIEEEDGEDSRHLTKVDKTIGQFSIDTAAQRSPGNCTRDISIRPEVEQALQILEKAISVVREYRCSVSSLAKSSFSVANEEKVNMENGEEKDSKFSEVVGVCSNTEVSVQVAEEGIVPKRSSHEYRKSLSIRESSRHVGSSSSAREMNHNKIAPASPEQHLSPPDTSNQDAIVDLTVQESKPTTIKTNATKELHQGQKLSRQRIHSFCCFGGPSSH